MSITFHGVSAKFKKSFRKLRTSEGSVRVSFWGFFTGVPNSLKGILGGRFKRFLRRFQGLQRVSYRFEERFREFCIDFRRVAVGFREFHEVSRSSSRISERFKEVFRCVLEVSRTPSWFQGVFRCVSRSVSDISEVSGLCLGTFVCVFGEFGEFKHV